jgi:hypothetical protein
MEPTPEQPTKIGITDSGRIILLEYEIKTLRRAVIILGLTTICISVSTVYLALH